MSKKKTRKSLSFKERVLLAILAVIAIVYITNNFFLVSVKNRLSEAEQTLAQRLTQYEVITNEISNKVLYEDRISALSDAESQLMKRYPTELSEEALLLKTLAFAKKANVHISTYGVTEMLESTLADVSTDASNELTEEEKIQKAVTEQAGQYTAQVEEDVKKRYEDELGISLSDEEDKNEVKAVSLSDLLDVSNNEALKNQLTALNATVLTRNISISVSGNYEQIMTFLDLVEQDEQAVFIENSSYNASDSKIAANMVLKFVGYYDTEVNGPVKINVPDGTGQSQDIFSEGDTLIDDSLAMIQASAHGDLQLILKNYLVNGAKIVMMQNNVDNSLRYHYDNDVISLRIDLSDAENGVLFTYNLAGSRYTSIISACEDKSEVLLEIVSSIRVDNDDHVGIKLFIDNKSSKALKITKSNDDENSRIMVGELKGQVQFEQ
jgi:Tfp pilus assembly protein PilO